MRTRITIQRSRFLMVAFKEFDSLPGYLVPNTVFTAAKRGCPGRPA